MTKLAIVRVLRKTSQYLVSQRLLKYEILPPIGYEERAKQCSILMKQSFLIADLGLKKITWHSSAWPHCDVPQALIYKRESILPPHLGAGLPIP